MGLYDPNRQPFTRVPALTSPAYCAVPFAVHFAVQLVVHGCLPLCERFRCEKVHRNNADMSQDNAGRQASLLQKLEVLDFHDYQTKHHPTHKQSDTCKYFLEDGRIPISKSALSRWIQQELQIRYDAHRLTERTKERSRGPREGGKDSLLVKQFLQDNEHILLCMEHFYIQNLLANKDDEIPHDREIMEKFNEFKILYGELDLVQKGFLINNESWPKAFFKSLEPKLEPLRLSVRQQRLYSRKCKSLTSERDRLQRALRGYNFENIYQFSEVLIDVSSILSLTDFTNIEYLENLEYPMASPSDVGMVTLGIAANLAGYDFPEPLMVSNLPNSTNEFNQTPLDPYYFYDPDGFNTREILIQYLSTWNLQLRANEKSIALILDSYWCHYGLGKSSLYRFSNIQLVFVSSRYDKTSSLHHRILLRLPFALGFERLVKTHVKQTLYKKLLSEGKALGRTKLLNDGHGITNCVRYTYKDVVGLIQKDYAYLVLFKLGVVGSRIFEKGKPAIEDSSDEYTDTEYLPPEVYLRMGTFMRDNIPIDFRNDIYYSQKRKVLILRKDEQNFRHTVEDIAAAFKDKRRSAPPLQTLQKIISRDLAHGNNETKFNKHYSMTEMVERVKRQIEHENTIQTDPEKPTLKNAEAVRFLSRRLQPLLYMQDQYAEQPLDTIELFHKFYMSYIRDNTEIVTMPARYRRKRPRPATATVDLEPLQEPDHSTQTPSVSGSETEVSSDEEEEPQFKRKTYYVPEKDGSSSPIRTKRSLRSVTPSSPTYRAAFSDSE